MEDGWKTLLKAINFKMNRQSHGSPTRLLWHQHLMGEFSGLLPLLRLFLPYLVFSADSETVRPNLCESSDNHNVTQNNEFITVKEGNSGANEDTDENRTPAATQSERTGAGFYTTRQTSTS